MNRLNRLNGLNRLTRLAGAVAVAAATVVASTTIATAAKPSHHDRSDRLQADLQAMVDDGAPGALLLVRNGGRARIRVAGVGDLDTGTPLRAGDHFKIASLTKTYTATTVLQLVAERRLRLDEVIEPFVPGLVPGGDQITIRQLLQHTSGLPDFEDDPRYLEPYLSGDYGHYWSPRQLVEMAMSHPVRFPPGRTETTSYSNTNYVLLGMIVEAVTGRPIGDVLEQRLFRPLRLSDTSYPTEPGLPEPYAHGYLSLGGPPIDVTGLSPSLSPASGAIVATAVDVTDFYRALLAGRLLPRRLLTAMKTTMSEGDRVDIPGQRYGLGLEMFPTRCGPAWGHNGVVPGYFTFVYSTEDGSRQALLFVNHDSSSLPQAAADRFFPLIEDAFCGTARR